MRTRDAVQNTLLAAALAMPTYSGTADRRQPAPCIPPSGSIYHGQLQQSLAAYTNDAFTVFARGLNFLADKGVDSAPRRTDCGPGCLYKGPANERDDQSPLNVLVSNHPVCDAASISHDRLPANGVVIGRLTHIRERPFGARRAGDASFNVRRATPGANPGRSADHYVVVVPGAKIVDKSTYAIWKIVTLIDRAGSRPVAVVDSGLFRVCLPKHPIPSDTLASFRSCAEVSELHSLSLVRVVQLAVVGAQVDSAEAQRRTFSLLVRADSGAIDNLNKIDPGILFGAQRSIRDDEDTEPLTSHHGPFARAVYSERPRLRGLFTERYGELHLDAPLWYVCAQGCCSGEPW